MSAEIIGAPVRAQIIQELRRLWINTRYQVELELKIQEQLRLVLKRDVTESQKQLIDRVRDCQVAIELLDGELAELESKD